MDPKRSICWEAGYKDSSGNPFTILGSATNHCPVCLVTAESTELVQLFARAKVMREFGATPYGGDMMKWPARIVDAFVTLENEHKKIERLSIPRNRDSHSKRRAS